MSIRSVNPVNGQELKSYPSIPLSEALSLLSKQAEAFQQWRELSFDQRGLCFKRAAENLRQNKQAYALQITAEMGKPVAQGVAEIEKSAWVCDYYAEHAATMLADQVVPEVEGEAFITHQPLGVILAIMPWNYPFWQVFRAAVPSMMAGNVMALKHASNVPQCALTIEAIFQNSGFPLHGLRAYLASNHTTAALIASREIRAITLTGSTRAGETVAGLAGTQVKKCVLELGGNDAYIIMPDADLELAAKACVESRILNAGQSCIAAKRLLVCEPVADEFVQALLQRIQAIQLGDPTDFDTRLGPLARVDLRDQLHQQVRETIDSGAHCLAGGTIPDRAGAWYPATLLDNVQPGSPAYEDELFGPVIAVIRVKDEQEAITVANSSQFGLGGGIFSRDVAKARRIARDQLYTGNCFINACTRSDPRLPFGGVAKSGYGRELSSHGIKEFVNIKTIVRPASQ